MSDRCANCGSFYNSACSHWPHCRPLDNIAEEAESELRRKKGILAGLYQTDDGYNIVMKPVAGMCLAVGFAAVVVFIGVLCIHYFVVPSLSAGEIPL
jgi:hypothetical protein